MITDLVPDDLTPAERLRGAAATIREHLAKLTASSGLIGAAQPPFQFLVAVATEQGMGVLLALPGDDFLADIERVTAPATATVAEPPKGVRIDPSLLAWSIAPDGDET